MVSTEGCSEGNFGTTYYDAGSTVCLLDPEATDDLHNVPLDADQPPTPEGSELNCIVENIPEKEIPANAQNAPDRRSSCSELLFIILLLLFIVLTFLAGLALALHILDLHLNNHLLQTLTEKLDAQSQILAPMVANQHLAGHNPGGL